MAPHETLTRKIVICKQFYNKIIVGETEKLFSLVKAMILKYEETFCSCNT